jgi:phytanoyl-CoA hydroxylase
VPALHPWNTDFRWRDHVGPFTTISDEQAAAFDREGFFVFPDAFDAATIRRIDDELAPSVAQVADFLARLDGGRLSVAGLDTQIVAPHAVRRSPWLRELAGAPPLAGIVRDLVGPGARVYWDQAVYKQAHSAEPVLFHQDNGYTYVEPQAYLTCWIAITPATTDNGCVRAVPGAHRAGTLAHRDTPIGYEYAGDVTHAVDIPVGAGSIVVFSSLTPHATGHNVTDEVRKAYILQYAPDGAVAYDGDGTGAQSSPRRLDDPAVQFTVVPA